MTEITSNTVESIQTGEITSNIAKPSRSFFD